MSRMRKLAQAGVAAMALSAVVSASAGTAFADPVAPPSVDRPYDAVGSDTIQSVWNALTNAKKPAIAGVASWDATPQYGTITTDPDPACTFTRPTGSTAGIKALSAAWDPNNHTFTAPTDANGSTASYTLDNNCLDFARSSARPNTTSYPGTDLTFLPFARDAVSVAVYPYGSGTATNLTTAQLKAIYGGSDDNTSGTGITYDAANGGLPVLNGQDLDPLLPQASSGTRSFFLGAIGNPSLANYVDPASSIVENDGTYLTQPGDLIPFSAGQWIAQNNGVQSPNTTGGLTMTSINGLAPFTGKKKLATGPLFGTSDKKGVYQVPPGTGAGVFARDTYDVVPSSFLGSGATSEQTTLVNELTGTAKGQLGNAAAVKVITSYGFGQLGYAGDSSYYLKSGYYH